MADSAQHATDRRSKRLRGMDTVVGHATGAGSMIRIWPRILKSAVIILIATHIGLGVFSSAQQSVTVDEIFHVTGGYAFNRLNDFRIHPDNGVLPQRLHALPAFIAGASSPPLGTDQAWHGPDVARVCYQFF